jgi:hypothetical protein
MTAGRLHVASVALGVVLGAIAMLAIVRPPWLAGIDAERAGRPGAEATRPTPSATAAAPAAPPEVDDPPSMWDRRFGALKAHVGPEDNNVWVYTRRFAEAYGMPRRWIDDSLLGAEAVAFRSHDLGVRNCGWGGRQEICPRFVHPVLDIYIPSDVPLPWVGPHRAEYHALTRTSADIVGETWIFEDDLAARAGSRRQRRINLVSRTEAGLAGMAYEGPAATFPANRVPAGWRWSSWSIIAYDRDVLPGLTLLVLDGARPQIAREGGAVGFAFSLGSPAVAAHSARAYRENSEDQLTEMFFHGLPAAHFVSVPEPFMRRAIDAHRNRGMNWRGLFEQIIPQKEN